MKDTTGENQQKKRGKPPGNAFEIGVIRVFSRPAPDARDRLRRVITLMIKHATRDRQAAHGDDAHPDDLNAEGRAKALAADEWDMAKDGQQDGFGIDCDGHRGV